MWAGGGGGGRRGEGGWRVVKRCITNIPAIFINEFFFIIISRGSQA